MARKAFNRGKNMVKVHSGLPDLRWKLDEGMTLDELGLYIHSLKQTHGSEAILSVTYDGWDESIECTLTGERLETDDEHRRRVERYDKAQATKALKAKPPTAAEKRAAEKQKKIEAVITEAKKLGLTVSQ